MTSKLVTPTLTPNPNSLVFLGIKFYYAGSRFLLSITAQAYLFL